MHHSQYTTYPQSLDRNYWLTDILLLVNQNVLFQLSLPDELVIDLDSIDVSRLEPFHFATLACLIEHYHKNEKKVGFRGNDTVKRLLFDTLQFRKYWVEGDNYAESQDETVLNLWRIRNEEKEVHSQRVHDYLKRKFFRNKDLSAVKSCLNELYYNIFDHAEADGNAFSFIKYDEQEQKLYVAVCDFGTGIAAKVRSHSPEIMTDHEAIEKAMEDSFSTHSQSHNAGMGLGNIRNACTDKDALRIISNNGFLYADRKEIVADPTHYNFKGTLIYFELSLSHFEDEEIITTFEF